MNGLQTYNGCSYLKHSIKLADSKSVFNKKQVILYVCNFITQDKKKQVIFLEGITVRILFTHIIFCL